MTKPFTSLGRLLTALSARSIPSRSARARFKPQTTRWAMETLESRCLLSALSFSAHQDYATGVNPQSIATGDFNNDGFADLVVSNFGNGSPIGSSVSVMLNNGNGTFATAVQYTTGSGPFSMAVADVNHDGKLDLVTANTAGNSISVLLGVGDGTFGAKIDSSATYGPIALAVGNFNNDVYPDLAVIDNPDGYAVTTMFGYGDGTFMPGNNYYGIGNGPIAITTTDVNADNHADLIAVDSSDNTVSIFTGNANGTFNGRVNYATGNDPFGVAAADFNSDGKPDLVVPNTNAGSVSVLLNSGEGLFSPKVDYATGLVPYAVATADFNGDGKIDLVTTDIVNGVGSCVSVLLGNGDGTFGTNTDFPTGVGPAHVVAADFNGDGSVDVAVNNSTDNTVSVLLTSNNNAPTNFALSSTTIAENRPAGTTVGTLSSSDPDAGNTFTYSLVGGSGSTDNAAFSISGASLLTATSFNFATQSSYSIRLRTTDQGGLYYEKVFVISVTAINHAPSFTAGPDVIVNEDSGAHAQSWATAISAGPSNESSQTLNFIVSNDNNALFAVQPTIAANGTLSFTPAINTFGSTIVTVRLHDNGGTANGGVDLSAPQTFTIQVSPINHPPTALTQEASVNEDGSVNIPLTGSDIETPAANLIFAVSQQPAHGSLTLVGSVATYQPQADYFGPDNFYFTVTDTGNPDVETALTSAPAAVSIVVNSVNDAPSFTASNPPTVLGVGVHQSVSQWISSFSTGPSNEAAQHVTYIVSNISNPNLFSVLPAISSNGTLAYTPKAAGSSTFDVVIHDNGGTNNGGVDTSPIQTFTIVVNAITPPTRKPTLSVTANKPLASEKNPTTKGRGQYTITRTGGDMAQPLTVNYHMLGSAINDVDYQNLSGSVTIPAKAKSVMIDLIPVTDSLVEGLETAVLSLLADEGPSYSINPLKGSAKVTIADSQPYFDLQINRVIFAPTTISNATSEKSKLITMTAIVQNVGTLGATDHDGGFAVKFELVSVTNEAVVYTLGAVQVPSLKAGAASSEKLVIDWNTLAGKPTPGGYRLRAVIGSDSTLVDINLLNNQLNAANTLQITA